MSRLAIALTVVLTAPVLAFSQTVGDRGRKEVVDLHDYFVGWFDGSLPDDDAAFARIADALGEGFLLVGPDGAAQGRDAVVRDLRAAHGRWGDGGGSIRVEDVRVVHETPDRALVVYVERQEHDGVRTARISSVLFGRREDAPNGVEWLHLHETWLPEEESVAAAPQLGQRIVDPEVYGHVVHVGWVVRNLEPVLAYWRRLGLRIGGPTPVALPDVVYRGRRVAVSMRIARATIGGVGVQWIEPEGGEPNVYTEFLERHGDGVHHVAFAVPSADRFEQELQRFASRGVDTVQRGSWTGERGEGRFGYLDTAPRGGGLTLELIWDPDADAASALDEPDHAPPFDRISQYAVVVEDLQKVSDFYASLGFGGLQIDPPQDLDDLEYRGEPVHHSMSLGWDRSGDVTFEWIESVQGPNVYEDVLEQRGEGFHHLGFDVPDMDAAIARFEALGVTVSQSGAWNFPSSRGRYAYLETDPVGGVLIELLWNDPDWPE